MDNNIKRRLYAAPSAELICLAPAAPIASWKWDGTGRGKWNQNNWGSPIANLFENASATGIAEWAGNDELEAD